MLAWTELKVEVMRMHIEEKYGAFVAFFGWGEWLGLFEAMVEDAWRIIVAEER